MTFTIIAHRGDSTTAPGNTLAAFRAAHDLGADGVELDVRLSRDGIPFVHHDWYVDESDAEPVPIHSLTAAELREQTVRDHRAELSGRHSIPMLSDVLEEFAGKLRLEIELKSPEPELPRAAVAALAPFRHAWPTIELTSASASLLAHVHELCPGIRTALLCGSTKRYMRRDVVAYLAVQTARLAMTHVVHLGRDQLSDEVLSTVRGAGLDVHVYPVDDEQGVELASHWQIHEVITDDPRAVLRIRDIATV